MRTRLLLRAAARFHLRSPLQLSLSVAGIALGVAVFIGVDIANTSANAAFESSAEFVRGAASHRILPLTDSLDESIFFEEIAPRGIVAAPVIEAPVRLAGSRATATLLGVDAIEEAAFRDATRIGLLGGSASESLITMPDTTLVSPGLTTTRTIAIDTAAGTRELRVVGTLPRDSGSTALLIVDIATAQEVLGMIGRLSRIDLILDAATETRLRAALPSGTVLVAAGNEDAAFRELSNAFRINILALGLLALAVGMFLVYSSATFSLVRRTQTFATLRVLGTDRFRLARVITLEFLLLGLGSSLIGVALGHALAALLIDLMLMTIDDFSFRGSVAVGAASPWLYARGLAIGVVATLAATIAPVRNAVRRDTSVAIRRSSLESLSRSHASSARRAAWILAFAAIALLLWPSRNLVVAFAGLFAVLAAAAAAVPASAAALVETFVRLFRGVLGIIGVQAARNVLAHQSRIAVATAALTLAVACVIGVGVMISSFRTSLEDWLETTLTSDIYVNLLNEDGAATQLVEYLLEDPRVEDISRSRFTAFSTASGPVRVRAFDPGQRGWGLQTISDSGPSTTSLLDAGAGVAITEPYSLRTGLTVGDELPLPISGDAGALPIVAVYRSYDAGGASVSISLQKFREMTDDAGIDGIGVELRDGFPVTEVVRDIEKAAPPGATRITTSAGIKRISLEIFDRTFLITEVLRLLAGAIAFLGMLSALMAVQIERRREFAILRSIGFAPRDLWRLIMTETAIIGTSAGLLAMPVGLLLAALLIYVINVRSFGWTMAFELQPFTLVPGAALAVFAALLAGIWPALRSYSEPVAAALRDDH